jgi:hypothetical protein
MRLGIVPGPCINWPSACASSSSLTFAVSSLAWVMDSSRPLSFSCPGTPTLHHCIPSGESSPRVPSHGPSGIIKVGAFWRRRPTFPPLGWRSGQGVCGSWWRLWWQAFSGESVYSLCPVPRRGLARCVYWFEGGVLPVLGQLGAQKIRRSSRFVTETPHMVCHMWDNLVSMSLSAGWCHSRFPGLIAGGQPGFLARGPVSPQIPWFGWDSASSCSPGILPASCSWGSASQGTL